MRRSVNPPHRSSAFCGYYRSAPRSSEITVFDSDPCSVLKSSVTFHAVGDVPFAKVCEAESQVSVPVANVYIENTFPFAPAVLLESGRAAGVIYADRGARLHRLQQRIRCVDRIRQRRDRVFQNVIRPGHGVRVLILQIREPYIISVARRAGQRKIRISALITSRRRCRVIRAAAHTRFFRWSRRATSQSPTRAATANRPSRNTSESIGIQFVRVS